MDDMDKMEQVCGYLRMIERTRLLRNTTEELERLVGFSVGSGNALARKGGKRTSRNLCVLSDALKIISDRQKKDKEVIGVLSGCRHRTPFPCFLLDSPNLRPVKGDKKENGIASVLPLCYILSKGLLT